MGRIRRGSPPPAPVRPPATIARARPPREWRRRLRRTTPAAQVHRHSPETCGEPLHLIDPQVMVERQSMDEHERRPRSGCLNSRCRVHWRDLSAFRCPFARYAVGYGSEPDWKFDRGRHAGGKHSSRCPSLGLPKPLRTDPFPADRQTQCSVPNPGRTIIARSLSQQH
jgi:hypothetical protein